ncbi:MAG: phosphoribosyltransferase family protein [Candidatus Jorgensenbacteria bacterium]
MEHIVPVARKLWRMFLDALFPPLCAACGILLPRNPPHDAICENCLAALAPRDGFCCPFCGARLPPPLADVLSPCHPESLFVLAAAMHYADPVPRALIRALKYGRTKAALAPLSSVLLPYLATALRGIPEIAADSRVIIPIPLHPRRLRERGFNQAALIAEALAAVPPLDGAAVLQDALARIRYTPTQTAEAGPKKRQENVVGCFVLRRPESIRGKTVFLVDDVFTSGATMGEAAKILHAGGAKRIIGVVIAKA